MATPDTIIGTGTFVLYAHRIYVPVPIISQRQMIDQGNILGAFEMDVTNLRNLFGGKYDAAISQAREYLQRLINQ